MSIGKLCFTAILAAIGLNAAAADFFDLDIAGGAEERSLENTKADLWSIDGKNIVAKGNVYIPYRNITIYADRAIVNTETKDIEATGNIRIYRANRQKATISIDELLRLQKNPNTLVVIDEYVMTPLGEQQIKVTVYSEGDLVQADRISGNLASGVIYFKNFRGRFKNFLCKAESGIRKPGGEIEIKNAEITSCEYMTSDHEHYSVKCGTAKIYPYKSEAMGFSGYNPDPGEHSIWGYNCVLNIFGVPSLWLPMFYKPKDESPGILKVSGGYSSGWGYFFSLSKRFQLLDDPYSTLKLMTDFYSLRGVGYGADLEINTEESKTRLFYYGIYDTRPYNSEDIEGVSRLTIPNYRYDVALSNLTHITPRLDFRGNFEMMSDYYFKNDYFSSDFANNPQPTTFSSLEYQFDRVSTAFYVRPKVNSFFSEVQRLPEFRLDLPRQELFNNIYHQGETSLDYLSMNWRKYDVARTTGNQVDPTNYSSGRFDTLNMFYYPFKLDWLNIIPRAGLRLTGYTNSSKTKINESDLQELFLVDIPDQQEPGNVINYDNEGGGKFRAIGEVGTEVNTKITRSWQNVKNAYWQLDGLRHVIQPYVNYTYIPDPTVKRDELYYFDDTDRITNENFARLGLMNRIQTRRGNYGSEKIYNWMSIENYMDYYFQRQSGFNNIGDLNTKLKFNPFPGLTLTSLLSLDIGQNNAHNAPTVRDGEDVSRKGLSSKWFNKWENTISYKLIDDITVRASYIYQDQYKEQSAYSMGSTLTDIESGSAFDKIYTYRIQTVRLGGDFPITPDRKTRGAYDIYYDFEAGYIREQRISIIRTLHCWEIAVELSQSRARNSDGSKDVSNSIMVTLYLTSMGSPLQQVQRSSYKTANNMTGNQGGS